MPPKPISLNILLLAAGKGLRFQASCSDKPQKSAIKQLVSIQGIPMINHSISQLRPLITQYNNTNKIYVALGANHQEIRSVLPTDITTLLSESFSLGMGHTLAESIDHIATESSHVLIALADQVLINTEHYQQLINKSLHEPEKIIATLSANKMMVPAIFPKKHFPELMKLTGDKGASALLKNYSNQVLTYPLENAKYDIDTMADLERVSLLLNLEDTMHTKTNLNSNLKNELNNNHNKTVKTWSMYDQNNLK